MGVELLGRRDQLEPRTSDRLVEGARASGTFRDAPDAGGQPLESLGEVVPLCKAPGDADVPLVREVDTLDLAEFERSGELVVIHTR